MKRRRKYNTERENLQGLEKKSDFINALFLVSTPDKISGSISDIRRK
jgi:hypothetical protein